MAIALFVPCYVDQLRPRVGLAALELLEACGHDVTFLDDAVCCGQPFLTAGESTLAAKTGARFGEIAANFEAIVTPSGSCAGTLRTHLPRWAPSAAEVAGRVVELTAFLAEGAELPAASGSFPYRVGLHASCHALRELRQGDPSETRDPPRGDPAATLLSRVPRLSLVDLTRRDECCGFGGVFAVEEEAVSSRMGRDRVRDHVRAGATIITSTDVSCLLHLEGLVRREAAKKPTPSVLHVAEILAESHLGEGWLAHHADEASPPLPPAPEPSHGAR